jgi:hypothetical protein
LAEIIAVYNISSSNEYVLNLVSIIAGLIIIIVAFLFFIDLHDLEIQVALFIGFFRVILDFLVIGSQLFDYLVYVDILG